MRKLLFNKKAYNEELATLQVLVDSINELGREFKKHGVKLTPEILKGFIENRIIDSPYPGTEKMTFTAHILVDATLAKVGRKAATEIFLQILTDQAESTAKNMDSYRKNISSDAQSARIVPENISFSGEKAVITEEEKTQIQETHTLYLRQEDEELYEKVQQFAESIAEMNSFLEGKLLISEYNLLDALAALGGGFVKRGWNFFKKEGESVIPDPEFFGTRQKRIDFKNPLS